MSALRLILGLFFIIIGIGALTGLNLIKFFISLVVIFIGIKILAGRHYWGGSLSNEENANNK